MHRFTIWVCCVALSGCQFSADIDSKPSITKHAEFVELKIGQLVSRVKVIDGPPRTTLTITEDAEDSLIYVARTEHDCKTRISTLRYLAVLDKDKKLLEEREVELALEVAPRSIGEAELNLACPTGKRLRGILYDTVV